MRKVFVCVISISALVVVGSFPMTTPALDKLIIATEQWPPYVYEKDGEIVGHSIEILDAVFAEMGVKTEMSQYPWARAMKLTFSGKADALFHASKQEDRMVYCYYPEEYLSNSRYVLFIRKADAGKLKFDSRDDLQGHKVGVTQGYSYTKEFLEFLQQHDLIEESPADENNFRMLAKGRIDYFPADVLNGIFTIKNLGLHDQLMYIDKPVFEKPYFIIFNKQNVPKAFVDTFSETLTRFKQTGRFQEIEEKYLH